MKWILAVLVGVMIGMALSPSSVDAQRPVVAFGQFGNSPVAVAMDTNGYVKVIVN